MRPTFAILVSILVFSGLNANSATLQEVQPVEAAEAFETLKGLVGHWKDTADGSPLVVEFRLTAGGSALVETWTMSGGRESLSIYHLDGDRLLATHYCPAGNQPRLQLSGQSADGRFHFEFESVTGLEDPADSHQHRLEVTAGQETLKRKDTYLSKGKPQDGEVELRRITSLSEQKDLNSKTPLSVEKPDAS